MKKYKVKLFETLVSTVIVEADNEQVAKDLALELIEERAPQVEYYQQYEFTEMHEVTE